MMSIYYDHLSWPEAKEILPSCRGVIIQLGSTEEHGYHMPLCVDNVLGNEMAERIAQKTNCLLLPLVPFGQVWSNREFPGTISLSNETLVALLMDVCLSLHRHGVKNIIMVTGHMGNHPSMKEAARKLYDQYDIKNIFYFCYTDYIKLSKDILEKPMWKGTGMHAAEFETSLMLAVKPELVHLEKAVIEYPEEVEQMDYRCMPWPDYTKTGAPGDPTVATAEKGELIIERQVDRIVELINKYVK